MAVKVKEAPPCGYEAWDSSSCSPCCRSKSDSYEEACDVYQISVAQRLSLVDSGCQHRLDRRSVDLASSPIRDRLSILWKHQVG